MAENPDGVGQTERFRKEWSAGGVVVRPAPEEHRILLIRDPYGKWGLPKGHMEPGEEPGETAVREVVEETGLKDVELGPYLTTIDWHFRLRGWLVHKHCHFYLMASRNGEPRPEVEEGIREVRWVPLAEAPDAVSYDNAREVVRRAGEAVTPVADTSAVEDFPPWRTEG